MSGTPEVDTTTAGSDAQAPGAARGERDHDAGTDGDHDAGTGGERRRGVLASFRYYYPLTLFGTALLGASFYLAGSAYATGNPYEIVLAAFAFFALAALAAVGRIQAFRYQNVDVEWNTQAPLIARATGSRHTLYAARVRPYIFYRLHLALSGRLDCGNGAGMRLYREIASAGGGEIPVPLDLPVCGALDVTAALSIRDVFGLTRARFGHTEKRRLTVLPALLGDRDTPHVDVTVGYDTTLRNKSSDEEKYYMREYMPGDRFKDINWKASSKLDELITRISPVTQEQTKLITVELRHFRGAGGPSLDAVLHLNFLKSWLMTFLRSIKQRHPEYSFQVLTGYGPSLLQSEADLARFERELAMLTYLGGPVVQIEDRPGELFVFTTMFDADLSRSLRRWGPAARVNVFRTVAATGRAGRSQESPARNSRNGNGTAAAAARHADVRDRSQVPLFARELPALLPGPWSLRRERPTALLPAVGAGMVEDEELEVRYL